MYRAYQSLRYGQLVPNIIHPVDILHEFVVIPLQSLGSLIRQSLVLVHLPLCLHQGVHSLLVYLHLEQRPACLFLLLAELFGSLTVLCFEPT